jgi:hypothetical protein
VQEIWRKRGMRGGEGRRGRSDEKKGRRRGKGSVRIRRIRK